MKIQFDSDQAYQHQAIRSVVDVFEGQPLVAGRRTMRWGMGFSGSLTELGFGNHCVLSNEAILQNVQTVQQRHGLSVGAALDGMHFSVEME